MKNIKFRYLYRDGGNYKRFGEVVFSNESRLDVVTVTNYLRGYFLVDGLFIANQVHIPEMFFTEQDDLNTDDHCFHEFDRVEVVEVPPTDSRSITQFITDVKAEAQKGWFAFDVSEAGGITAP